MTKEEILKLAEESGLDDLYLTSHGKRWKVTELALPELEAFYRAAFNAGLEAATVPTGWKLVPIEPTDEMINAGWEHRDGYVDEMYKSMLAAAPEYKE